MKVGKKVNKYKERYMQIPKTVEQMILRRERLAIQLDDAMNALDHWLDKNGVNYPPLNAIASEVGACYLQ